MGRLVLAGFLVLVIIYVVPFLVYGLFTVIAGLAPPQGASPGRFLVSVLVSKVGTAVAFAGIFYLARTALAGRWWGYAVLWWVMFVVGEVGQALGPGYSWKEAIAGIISETIYVPAAAFLTHRLLGRG